jgi:hypothetical protein
MQFLPPSMSDPKSQARMWRSANVTATCSPRHQNARAGTGTSTLQKLVTISVRFGVGQSDTIPVTARWLAPHYDLEDNLYVWMD